MADDFENQIVYDELKYKTDLENDRARQALAAATAGQDATEKAGSNLNIIELALLLILALGVDFGIGWLGGKLAAASAGLSIVPLIGKIGSAILISAIMALVKFTTFCTAMILWLWCLLRLKRLPWKRLGAATFIEVIPFIGELVPGWTGFILSIIIKEKIMPMLQKQGMAPEVVAKMIRAAQKT